MLIVHHLNDSRSQRILWLLEELEVPYEIKKYQRTKDRLAPKELLEVHPLGKSPVITDDGVTLAESGAIIDYIIKKYGNGNFLTTTDSGYLSNLYFSYYAEGSLMPILVMYIVCSVIPQRAPWFIRPLVNFIMGGVSKAFIYPRIVQQTNFVESHFEKHQWFSGEDHPTAADINMSFPCEALVTEKMAGPKITEYVNRIAERPAYQRALEKGGEYAFAPKS